MNYIKLELGQLYTLALKYPTPREVKGLNGPQLRWILVDGRALYTPLSFKAQVEALGLRAGHAFQVVRSRENGRVAWKVQRYAQPAATLLDGVGSLDGLIPDSVDPPKIPPQLERALTAAVHAAAIAEKHAKTLGIELRFSPTDVREIAVRLYRGGKHAA